MSGLVLHTHTSTTHATNLATSLNYVACKLPFKKENYPRISDLNIAVLILGPEFLKKEVENDPLLDEVLAKSTEDDFHLIPILLAECAWEDSIYNGLSFFPKDKVPVLSTPDVHQHVVAMEVFSQKIKKIEEEIRSKKIPHLSNITYRLI